MEVIKYFSGYGKPLKDRMLVFDGEEASFLELKIHRDPGCPDCAESHGRAG